jgi:hypothetical protein
MPLYENTEELFGGFGDYPMSLAERTCRSPSLQGCSMNFGSINNHIPLTGNATVMAGKTGIDHGKDI